MGVQGLYFLFCLIVLEGPYGNVADSGTNNTIYSTNSTNSPVYYTNSTNSPVYTNSTNSPVYTNSTNSPVYSTNSPTTSVNHNFPTKERDICRCPGANLACLRHENSTSTSNGCPVCPTSCATPPPPECSYDVKCGDGRECEIRDDSSYRCAPESAAGEKCMYIDSCFGNQECGGMLMGRKIEKKCTPGFFCRSSRRYSCVAMGICVTIANASDHEAGCLKDQNSDKSHCSPDGNYKCSSSEATDNGDIIQTCYNRTTGRPIKQTKRNANAEKYNIEENCRRENFASCRTRNGRVVLSGDYVEDPNNPCSYCMCHDGEIDRSMCRRNLRCILAPKDCKIGGRTISHGRVLSIPSTCVQKRCEDGKLIATTFDTDCDGKDDIDTCDEQEDTDMVCAMAASGIRARVQKCKARSIGANYSEGGYCGQDEVCNCQSDEICVETRRRDLCITTDSNGCKSKKCIPMNSTITCSTDIRNQPVCSSSGVTYKSECEAFVNQDYNMKYLRACDDSACQNTNKGQGFCGFDNNTYADLCELEMTTGDTKRDYNGSCVRRDDKGRNKCDKIPEECRFATRSSDSACPIAGAQGVLYIDVEEAKDFAFRKGKSELTGRDLCEEALSDWEMLTQLQLSDTSCEVTCRPKYDTVGAIIVQVRAVQGTDCVTCGDRLKLFIRKLREDKSGESSGTSTSNRRRRQTDDSESTGSGLFISPSELANDPTYYASGAMNLLSSSLLVLISLFIILI